MVLDECVVLWLHVLIVLVDNGSFNFHGCGLSTATKDTYTARYECSNSKFYHKRGFCLSVNEATRRDRPWGSRRDEPPDHTGLQDRRARDRVASCDPASFVRARLARN
jgi:hypothetical protein